MDERGARNVAKSDVSATPRESEVVLQLRKALKEFPHLQKKGEWIEAQERSLQEVRDWWGKRVALEAKKPGCWKEVCDAVEIACDNRFLPANFSALSLWKALPIHLKRVLWFDSEALDWFRKAAKTVRGTKLLKAVSLQSFWEEGRGEQEAGLPVNSAFQEIFDSRLRLKWLKSWMFMERLEAEKRRDIQKFWDSLDFRLTEGYQLKPYRKNASLQSSKQRKGARGRAKIKVKRGGDRAEEEEEEEDEKKDEEEQTETKEEEGRSERDDEMRQKLDAERLVTPELKSILKNYKGPQAGSTRKWIEWAHAPTQVIELQDIFRKRFGERENEQGKIPPRRKFQQVECNSRSWWERWNGRANLWKALWADPSLLPYPLPLHLSSSSSTFSPLSRNTLIRASDYVDLPLVTIPSGLRGSLLLARLQGALRCHIFPKSGCYLAPWSFVPAKLNERKWAKTAARLRGTEKEGLEKKVEEINSAFQWKLGVFTLIPRHSQELIVEWKGNNIGSEVADREIGHAFSPRADPNLAVAWKRKEIYFQSFQIKQKTFLIDVLDEKGKFFGVNPEQEHFAHFINEPPPQNSDNVCASQCDVQTEESESDSGFLSSSSSSSSAISSASPFSSSSFPGGRRTKQNRQRGKRRDEGVTQVVVQTLVEVAANEELFLCYRLYDTSRTDQKKEVKRRSQLSEPSELNELGELNPHFRAPLQNYKVGRHLEDEVRTLRVFVSSDVIRSALRKYPFLLEILADYMTTRLFKYEIDSFCWRTTGGPSLFSVLKSQNTC